MEISHGRQSRSKEEEADEEVPTSTKLPYVTTSDVLKQLNKNLKDLAATDDESSPLAGFEPRFELQKRLPDGSTVPASSADLAASDLNTKIQQSAKFVTEYLDSDEERAKWAESQRQVGNTYFAKADYRNAMDVYLTCLVVKQDNEVFLNQTLLPVLNNLAQCTLQLSMHKKTMEFCDIAFEEIQKFPVTVDPVVKCKIYFKRAKARRLRGSYGFARDDLNTASSCIDAAQQWQSSKNDEKDSFVPYRQAVQKEFRLLESAEKEARKNRQRQKRAMQKALWAPEDSSKANSSLSEAFVHASASDMSHASPSEKPSASRKYSTLRARKPAADAEMSSSQDRKEMEDIRDDWSYWQYYCLVVARVAEALLIWLGDEETKRQVRQRKEETKE